MKRNDEQPEQAECCWEYVLLLHTVVGNLF